MKVAPWGSTVGQWWGNGGVVLGKGYRCLLVASTSWAIRFSTQDTTPADLTLRSFSSPTPGPWHSILFFPGGFYPIWPHQPHPPFHAPAHTSIHLKDAPDAEALVCLLLSDLLCDAALAHASAPRTRATLHTIWLQTDFDHKLLNPF